MDAWHPGDTTHVPGESRSDGSPDDRRNAGLLDRIQPSPAVDVLQVDQDGVDLFRFRLFDPRGQFLGLFDRRRLDLERYLSLASPFLESCFLFLSVSFPIVGGTGPTDPIGRRCA